MVGRCRHRAGARRHRRWRAAAESARRTSRHIAPCRGKRLSPPTPPARSQPLLESHYPPPGQCSSKNHHFAKVRGIWRAFWFAERAGRAFYTSRGEKPPAAPYAEAVGNVTVYYPRRQAILVVFTVTGYGLTRNRSTISSWRRRKCRGAQRTFSFQQPKSRTGCRMPAKERQASDRTACFRRQLYRRRIRRRVPKCWRRKTVMSSRINSCRHGEMNGAANNALFMSAFRSRESRIAQPGDSWRSQVGMSSSHTSKESMVDDVKVLQRRADRAKRLSFCRRNGWPASRDSLSPIAKVYHPGSAHEVVPASRNCRRGGRRRRVVAARQRRTRSREWRCGESCVNIR